MFTLGSKGPPVREFSTLSLALASPATSNRKGAITLRSLGAQDKSHVFKVEA